MTKETMTIRVTVATVIDVEVDATTFGALRQLCGDASRFAFYADEHTDGLDALDEAVMDKLAEIDDVFDIDSDHRIVTMLSPIAIDADENDIAAFDAIAADEPATANFHVDPNRVREIAATRRWYRG